MKIWMLVPTKKGFKVIERIYSDAYLIVRAETEERARDIARNKAFVANVPIWNDPDLSICNELTSTGEEGVIVDSIQPAYVM